MHLHQKQKDSGNNQAVIRESTYPQKKWGMSPSE